MKAAAAGSGRDRLRGSEGSQTLADVNSEALQMGIGLESGKQATAAAGRRIHTRGRQSEPGSEEPRAGTPRAAHVAAGVP